MIIILTIIVFALGVTVYLMNEQIRDLHEALSSELNLLKALESWQADVDKRIDVADEIARNARSRTRELAEKMKRSVIYEEK
jgi:predicted Holliday junction resolvase-like endonuclease